MKTAFSRLLQIPGVLFMALVLTVILVWEVLKAIYVVAVLGESPDEEGTL